MLNSCHCLTRLWVSFEFDTLRARVVCDTWERHVSDKYQLFDLQLHQSIPAKTRADLGALLTRLSSSDACTMCLVINDDFRP